MSYYDDTSHDAWLQHASKILECRQEVTVAKSLSAAVLTQPSETFAALHLSGFGLDI
jgi:hypothetical protein